MESDNKNTGESTTTTKEEVIVETNTQPIVEVKPEVKYTEDQLQAKLNALDKKHNKKLTIEKNEKLTLEDRIKKLEVREIEVEAKEKLAEEQVIASKSEYLKSYIAKQTKEGYEDTVLAVVKAELETEKSSNKDIQTKVDEVIKRIPGIEKGTNITSTQLNNKDDSKKVTEVIQTNDPKYFRPNGSEMSKEDYDKLASIQKTQITIK